MSAACYLEPGGFQFGAAPLRLTTLLGSCVAVTLWHPRRHIGGMCHIQMPGRSQHAAEGKLDGRYAEDAFALFDREIARHGAPAKEYVAKLFGAANMFPNGNAAVLNIGAQNLATTRRELARRGFRIAAEHVGGAGHRKLSFDLASGEVRLTFSNLQTGKETAIG